MVTFFNSDIKMKYNLLNTNKEKYKIITNYMKHFKKLNVYEIIGIEIHINKDY